MLTSILLILLAVLVYGAVHSLLASLWAKAHARRLFGSLAERLYRLGYNVFAVLTLLPVLALPLVLPDEPLYSIPFPVTLLSLFIQALAGGVVLVGLLQTGLGSFLGLRQLAASPTEREPRLVVRGLYRWVRHPLYTAGLIFLWLTPVMTVNVLALDASLTAYIIIGALFEERRLLKEFGPAYQRYREETPMLIPGLKLS
jgi:protein-S-isoprenylcysteine O-methyltransferase Ste14